MGVLYDHERGGRHGSSLHVKGLQDRLRPRSAPAASHVERKNCTAGFFVRTTTSETLFINRNCGKDAPVSSPGLAAELQRAKSSLERIFFGPDNGLVYHNLTKDYCRSSDHLPRLLRSTPPDSGSAPVSACHISAVCSHRPSCSVFRCPACLRFPKTKFRHNRVFWIPRHGLLHLSALLNAACRATHGEAAANHTHL